MIDPSTTILVTGGAGFIGSGLVRYLVHRTSHHVINYDRLTYAGNLESVASVAGSDRYRFIRGDIADRDLLEQVFRESNPGVVMHLAAESHVDRSIDGPAEFIHTNIVGTSVILEVARKYWEGLTGERRSEFRFHHVSTDEVYGSLGDDGLFNEETAYDPSSPYSASKASSDHLVRAWSRTYGLPILVTNCSNNYGPYQFPEKLIPLMILNGLDGKELPVYGDGSQVRDWLYVEDHVRALYRVVSQGSVGETYNIGGCNERRNLEVVRSVCALLDDLVRMRPPGVRSYQDLITFVEDRPGHDQRYAIDAGKVKTQLGWVPNETFESGLRKTVTWYLNNADWWQHVLDGSYRRRGLGASDRRGAEVFA